MKNKIIIEKNREMCEDVLYRVYFEKDKLEAVGKSAIFRILENSNIKLSSIGADVEEYEDYFKNKLIIYLNKKRRGEVI